MALLYTAKKLKEMKIEARNGFRDFSRVKQSRIIYESKKQIDAMVKEYGSFLPNELKNIVKRTCRIIDRIYKPNMR